MDAAAQQLRAPRRARPRPSARGWPTLTSAEWGLVTSGCAAALTHATAACVAGGNPDLHVRIPNLRGFAKDEVDHPEALAQRLRRRDSRRRRARGRGHDARRARGGARAAHGDGLHPGRARGRQERADRRRRWRQIAQARGVPILVDAAAEILTIPNVHLQNGATLVAYSGGKCLRGPQTRGPAAGPQGPGEGRLGPQRAAPRLRARDEGRQGRGDRHADGGRDVGEARPRRRVEAVDGLARPHRDARRRPIDGVTTDDRAAGRPVEPHAVARDVAGTARRSASPATTVARTLLRHRAAHRAVRRGGARPATAMDGPASRSRRT